MACEQEARCGREGGLNISEGGDALQCVRTEGATECRVEMRNEMAMVGLRGSERCVSCGLSHRGVTAGPRLRLYPLNLGR